MANPKHKLSRLRTRRRRANDFIKTINLSKCPSCREVKMPHRICKSCGYYNGREIIRAQESTKTS